jgi:hypothetical protein
MKCRFYLIVSFFLLTTSQLNAQIKDEIKTYVDSTEVLVINGRKMMVNKILDNDYYKAHEIYQYLTSLTAGKTFSSFYYSEDIYLNISFGDWNSLVNILLDYSNIGHKYTYRTTSEILPLLGSKLSAKADSLLLECQNSNIDAESKKLIEIIIYVVKNGSNDQYNSKLSEFKKEYPNSKYDDILSNVLPQKKVKASMGFAMGSGLVSTTDNLKKSFGTNATINMSLDFGIQKIFTSIYFNGTSLKLKEPFSATNGTETLDFYNNESFQYLDAGFKCGYFIIRSSRFNLSPYASISGSSLQSKRYDDPDDNKKEYKVFNSFTYGPGLHSEIKLKEFKTSNRYYNYGYEHSFISFKVDAGFNFIAKHKDDYFKGNTPYVMVELIWGIGDF